MMKLCGFGPTRTLRAMWGPNELGVAFDCIHVDLLGGFPRLNAYPQRMHARQTAPRRIAEAFAGVQPQ